MTQMGCCEPTERAELTVGAEDAMVQAVSPRSCPQLPVDLNSDGKMRFNTCPGTSRGDHHFTVGTCDPVKLCGHCLQMTCLIRTYCLFHPDVTLFFSSNPEPEAIAWEKRDPDSYLHR